MALATLTETANAMKTLYLPGVRWQSDYASEVAAMIEKTSKNVQGHEIKCAVGYGATSGIGNRAETGTLPTAGPRKLLQLTIPTQNIYTTVSISDKLIEAAKSDQASYVNWFTDYMTHVESDLKKEVARQYQGDGTGIITSIVTVGAYAAGPPKTVALTVANAFFFEEGMLVDIIDTSGAVILASGSALKVNWVDEEANIIKLEVGSDITAAINTGGTDTICRSGNYNLELTGLSKVFTPDNTLYGVSRATYKFLNPTTYAVGGALTEIKLQAMIDKAKRKTGVPIDALVGSDGVVRAFQAHMNAYKSIMAHMELKGGYRVLDYDGVALIKDVFMPASTLYGMATPTFELNRLAPFDWVDMDGGIWARATDGTPGWTAWGREYCDLVCYQPRPNFKGTGITEQ